MGAVLGAITAGGQRIGSLWRRFRFVLFPTLALAMMAGLQQWIVAQVDDQLVALVLVLALAATLLGVLAPAFGKAR